MTDMSATPPDVIVLQKTCQQELLAKCDKLKRLLAVLSGGNS